MLKKTLALSAVSLMISLPAVAEDPSLSYTYVSAGYLSLDVDGEDFDGFGVSGSVAVSDAIFIAASYGTVESDDKYFGDEIDIDELSFGVGFHTPLNPTTDFVATVSYIDVEADWSGQSADGDGYGISAGIRSKPTDVVEIGAALSHVDIEDESDTGFSFSARVYSAPTVSFGLSFANIDDTDTIGLDARLDL